MLVKGARGIDYTVFRRPISSSSTSHHMYSPLTSCVISEKWTIRSSINAYLWHRDWLTLKNGTMSWRQYVHLALGVSGPRPTFCRRHFQIHFLASKLLCCDWNFTEIWYQSPINKKILALIIALCRIMNWTSNGLNYQRIYSPVSSQNTSRYCVISTAILNDVIWATNTEQM